nr:MAG TPA: hypothetical protein [Caudoviricetes sp.]
MYNTVKVKNYCSLHFAPSLNPHLLLPASDIRTRPLPSRRHLCRRNPGQLDTGPEARIPKYFFSSCSFPAYWPNSSFNRYWLPALAFAQFTAPAAVHLWLWRTRCFLGALSAHPLFYFLSGFCSRVFFTRLFLHPCPVWPVGQLNVIIADNFQFGKLPIEAPLLLPHHAFFPPVQATHIIFLFSFFP